MANTNTKPKSTEPKRIIRRVVDGDTVEMQVRMTSRQVDHANEAIERSVRQLEEFVRRARQERTHVCDWQNILVTVGAGVSAATCRDAVEESLAAMRFATEEVRPDVCESKEVAIGAAGR